MIQKFYAIKNKNDEIRVQSSSGGVFYELANLIIKDGGVVYGAIYDDNNDVIHYRATKKEELYKFFGSKYVQSNIGKSYENVLKDLKNNKKVLFSGTPCQINALKTITKELHNENLYLVDIVCHGAPQIRYFNDYKRYIENKYKSKIRNINMRYKNPKKYEKNIKKENISNKIISTHTLKLELDNGKVIEEMDLFNKYYQLFDYFMGTGCFKCPFSNLNRLSDITIGDFHTFKTNLGKFNDGNGVSLVIINSTKGDKLLEQLRDTFIIMEKEKEECLQPALSNPADKPKNYDEFYDDYQKYGFEYVVKKYGHKGLKYNIKKLLYKFKFYNIVRS